MFSDFSKLFLQRQDSLLLVALKFLFYYLQSQPYPSDAQKTGSRGGECHSPALSSFSELGHFFITELGCLPLCLHAPSPSSCARLRSVGSSQVFSELASDSGHYTLSSLYTWWPFQAFISSKNFHLSLFLFSFWVCLLLAVFCPLPASMCV